MSGTEDAGPAAGTLTAETPPAEPGAAATFSCHACGAARPDAAIAVRSLDRGWEMGLDTRTGTLIESFRYCRDQDACGGAAARWRGWTDTSDRPSKRKPILWSALRRTPRGWDELVTVAEAAAMGFGPYDYRESVGGGWAWFCNESDARKASPEGRVYQVHGLEFHDGRWLTTEELREARGG